jgi:hypothetical protein
VRNEGTNWQYRKLFHYVKPTIAMVNGWCLGGAFVPLVSCDLAIAAEDATFGLSEVNWGVTPGNLVTRALARTIPARDAMYFVMTGQHFDGRRASEMRLVNEAVPADQLRERTTALARQLTKLSPWVVRGAKMGVRHSRLMPWEPAEDFLYAKHDQATLFDSDARAEGMTQFLDDKTYAQSWAPTPRHRRLRRSTMTAGPDIIRVPLRVGGEPTEPADGRYFDKLKASGCGRFGSTAAIEEFTELRWITVSTQGRHYPI